MNRPSITFLGATLLVLLANNYSGRSEALDDIEKAQVKKLLLKAQAMTFSMRPSDAIPVYNQVLAKDPNNAAAYAGIGWIYFQLGKNTTAINYEKRAISLDPKSAEPHYYLSAIYTATKQYRTADTERIEAGKLAKAYPCNCGHAAQLSNQTPFRQ